MELLKSKKFKLPVLYFITDRKEIKELPIGIPFIFGAEQDKEFIIRLLEYEILYQKALSTGLPFNFKQILKDNGYKDIVDLWYHTTIYMDYKSEKFNDLSEDEIDLKGTSVKESASLFRTFIRDSAVYVDVKKLKDLNVFPIWLDKIEEAIVTNIHNFATYNHNMYNKKLEGMYGSLDLVAPDRNAIIVDISGSIPKGVSSTCLALSKQMCETFYADLIITGSKTTLYPYEELHRLNIHTIYEENGMDNDQVWFKKLVTSTERHYRTVIVFGDNHSPCQTWSNTYNRGTKEISREDGQKLCKWKIDKLISFHVNGTDYTAGYADWFTVSPENIEKIPNWVKYLNS